MNKSSGMMTVTALRRSALALAVGLACASGAMAQSAEGSLSGQSKAGASVTVVNVENGQQRTITAGKDGQFHFSKLQPGKYRVASDGISREVQVIMGSGSSVSLLTAELERVDVLGSRTRIIDVNSVESTTVFTSEQLRSLPVSRSIEAVAQLAPGVNKGDGGLGSGNLPVFSGASVAENGYYINGFDVTNIRNFLSYASLPFDAIAQQQVKSGGYGAEYGRSLGGVLSLVTKRGTNEWKGGASVYWNPDFLRATGMDVIDLNPDNASPLTKKPNYTRFRSANKTDQLSYNVYLGGPIIKDKLFVFGLVEGRNDRFDVFNQIDSYHEKSNRPNGLLKIDFSPNEHHQFELTAITDKSRRTRDTYLHSKQADAPAGTTANQLTDSRWYMASHLNNYGKLDRTVAEGGSDVLVGKYTAFITDAFTLSVLAGKVNSQRDFTTYADSIVPGCPRVYDPFPTVVGCWNPALAVSERDPKAPPRDLDKRRAMRIDTEYILGNHTLRAGYDAVKFTSGAAGSTYIGNGSYWRYYDGGTGAFPNAVPKGQRYVREWFSATTSGEYEVRNTAAYIEDSWKVDKHWLVYGGLRNETFDNRNDEGFSFVKATKLLAPRFGAAWDVNGDSSLKVYGNAGRYYIPIASNTNIRISRAEAFLEAFYTFTGRDPKTGAPTGLSAPFGVTGERDLHKADPATVADPNLKPMYQDEMILGMQKALSKDWTLGVKGVVRKVKNGMDDFCGGQPQKAWAVDNGYKNFKMPAAPDCIIINPGQDVSIKLDLENNGKLVLAKIPAKYFAMEPYKRNYKALEFSLDRRFDGHWGLGGSYVWAKQTGTAEGYVHSDLNQTDAGATQDFDFASFSHGSNGPGPNDRRHVFKVYGNYQVSDEWRLGANLLASSGRATSCNGFVPNTVADYERTDAHQGARDYTSASSYYCLGDDKKTHLTQRGSMGRTPWTYNANLNVAFLPKFADGKLTLQLDVFNVFNFQRFTEVNQSRDFSRANTNLQYSSKPADQASVRFNPNYRQPTDFQSPRSARVTARYEF